MMSRRPAPCRSLRALALCCLALAAGCASAPDHFHTLRPPAATVANAARGATQMLSIGPVTVPDSLDRAEWVIRTGDTGARVYDHQLWTQGLAADVAQTLVDYLNGGALADGSWADAGPTGSGSGADLAATPPLRVRVQVLRFDSMLAPPAVSDQVRWTIECLPSDATLSPVDAGRFRTVRTGVREVSAPAPEANLSLEEPQQRYDRVARAHSTAIHAVADDIAAALRDSAVQRGAACVK